MGSGMKRLSRRCLCLARRLPHNGPRQADSLPTLGCAQNVMKAPRFYADNKMFLLVRKRRPM